MLILIIAIVLLLAAAAAVYWLYTLVIKCDARVTQLENTLSVKAFETNVNGDESEPDRYDERLYPRREPTPLEPRGDTGSEEELDTPFVEDSVQSETGPPSS